MPLVRATVVGSETLVVGTVYGLVVSTKRSKRTTPYIVIEVSPSDPSVPASAQVRVVWGGSDPDKAREAQCRNSGSRVVYRRVGDTYQRT